MIPFNKKIYYNEHDTILTNVLHGFKMFYYLSFKTFDLFTHQWSSTYSIRTLKVSFVDIYCPQQKVCETEYLPVHLHVQVPAEGEWQMNINSTLWLHHDECLPLPFQVSLQDHNKN